MGPDLVISVTTDTLARNDMTKLAGKTWPSLPLQMS